MDNISFEQAMKRLEEIVSSMEKGNATLDETLTMFEEGTALVSLCNKKLNEAELKVSQLTKGPDGKPTETEFEYED